MIKSEQPATVFIVDDDDAIRDSMSMLMETIGLNTQSFASAQEFLDSFDVDKPGCLVLDIRMPGMSGLELQQELVRKNSMLPIVFVTGHGDIPMAVQAIQNGAADFIQKPFRDQDLLDRVNQALKSCHEVHNSQQQSQSVKAHIHNLTPREHQIMEMIVEGKANKVIAIDLGLSQRTIEAHRKNVMQKLEARSLADLVRIVTQTGLA